MSDAAFIDFDVQTVGLPEAFAKLRELLTPSEAGRVLEAAITRWADERVLPEWRERIKKVTGKAAESLGVTTVEIEDDAVLVHIGGRLGSGFQHGMVPRFLEQGVAGKKHVTPQPSAAPTWEVVEGSAVEELGRRIWDGLRARGSI
jgi:hypothetical protein